MFGWLVAYILVGVAWCGYSNYRVGRYRQMGTLNQAQDRHHALLWPISMAALYGHRFGRWCQKFNRS